MMKIKEFRNYVDEKFRPKTVKFKNSLPESVSVSRRSAV